MVRVFILLQSRSLAEAADVVSKVILLILASGPRPADASRFFCAQREISVHGVSEGPFLDCTVPPYR